MKAHTWQRISILVLFIFILTFTGWIVKASSLSAPTPPLPPIQGCNTATGTGPNFKTCAFYVVASSNIGATPTSNDAGRKPECNYIINDPEIYFGKCNSDSTPIESGFRFQNVSITIPTGQSILASYVEFTTDGDYGNLITTNIYGQAPAPTPKAFSGTNPSDVAVTTRPIVQPTQQWRIESTAKVYNMGDPWVWTDTRRTPDITSILTAIKGTNWQTNSNIVFLFKSDISNDTSGNPKSVGARRILAFERAGYKPARLVVRVGQIPRPSVSYYWQSVGCTGQGEARICTPTGSILKTKATKEAQRNQPVLVILDFGNPEATGSKMGTILVGKPLDYVPISKIEMQVKLYITEFVIKGSATSKLWLGIGTNNAGDLMCANQGYGTSHGTAWAAMINRLNTWVIQQNYNTASNPDKIKVSGASDIETWTGRPDSPTILKCGTQTLAIAPPSEALQWAQAYSIATNHSYINFGNYSDGAQGLGLNQWGADLTWELSWGIPEAYPLPEIYTPTGTLSAQWQTLARYSAICTGNPRCQPEIRADDPNWVAIKGRTMQFLGTLTNYGEQNCGINANSPNQGWLQLYRHLVVDLYTDNNFPVYSSDITYQEPAATEQSADTCPTP